MLPRIWYRWVQFKLYLFDFEIFYFDFFDIRFFSHYYWYTTMTVLLLHAAIRVPMYLFEHHLACDLVFLLKIIWKITEKMVKSLVGFDLTLSCWVTIWNFWSFFSKNTPDFCYIMVKNLKYWPSSLTSLAVEDWWVDSSFDLLLQYFDVHWENKTEELDEDGNAVMGSFTFKGNDFFRFFPWNPA